MITQVDVVKGDGSDDVVISLPVLGATPKSSLLIQKITGLNPPDINLFIGDYSRDGGVYQGRRVGKRNPVFTLELNPNPAVGETISSLREELYKAFVDPLVDADFIKLNMHDDAGRVRYLTGYTEKFETEIFSVDTMAQISVICPDPFIYDNDPTTLSHPTGWTTVPFTYGGSSETGFHVRIFITAPTSVLTLENNGKKMIINRGFAVGNVVAIGTNRGCRGLSVATTDGDPEVSILGSLSPESTWLELHGQANTMKVYGSDNTQIVAAIRELQYTNSYWGV